LQQLPLQPFSALGRFLFYLYRNDELMRRAEMADHLSTRAVHAGEEKHKPQNTLTTSIARTSTYTFRDTAEIIAYMQEKAAGSPPFSRYEYGRYSNPTQVAAERKLAALEGGERALLFASGMAATTTALLTLISSGDHILMGRDCFYQTREFAQTLLRRWGIETSFVEIDQPEAFAAAIKPKTRLIFVETPTNPYIRVADIAKIVEIARAHKLITLVDSTFATPVNLRPLELGVDLVIHSATKYLGGHNDLLAGVVIGSKQAVADIGIARGLMGGITNPDDSYLLLRGMKTLDLRVRRQNENGMRVAHFLEKHPAIERVHYPGLSSHPDHEVACRQMSGFGGVVSFEVKGDFEKTGRLLDSLHLPFIGPTLGGVESIVLQPAALYSLDPFERKLAGMKDNLVRYALGIEDADDLIADLAQALAQL
jgi:cystathionine gamma-synthase